MNNLQFEIQINAHPEKVWNTMQNPDTYKIWVSGGWPGSSFIGKWGEAEQIKFVGVDGGGGTLAVIEQFRPYELVEARHIAVINSDGTEDRESDVAKGWIGTKEKYLFEPVSSGTRLRVEITTLPNWEEMFQSGWPPSLKLLKELSEK